MMAFAVFLAAYILSQFFRSFLAVIAPELAAELALTPADLGDMQALWVLGFAGMQFPVGIALDRLGPRRTVTATMLFAVAGALVFARAETAGGLLAAMGLIGVGCSAIYMGALYIFGRVYGPQRFAFLASWLIGIGSIGNLVGTSPLAFAAETIGWRMTFVAIAALTALSAALVYALIRDPPRAEGASASGLFAALSIRAIWPLLPIAGISYAILLAERGLWAGPYFAEVHGLDAIVRGNALLLMAIAMSLGALAYGPLDRLLGTRKWVVVAGTVLTAALFLALARPSGVVASTAILAGIGFFGLTYAVLMAHARSFMPDHLLGRGMTLMNLFFIGGAGVVQAISGRFMAAAKQAAVAPAEAYASLHLAFACVLAAALAVYLFSREQRP